MRVLLLATTTGYQTRAFGAAAERLGVDLLFATDRCGVLDDPWRDAAVPIRFGNPSAATDTIMAEVARRPIDGVLAVGDRPAVIAACVSERLGLPGHPPAAAAIACDKLRTRERLREAGVPVPAFEPVRLSPAGGDPPPVKVPFPVVVKPLGLSGSRGVMRADDSASLAAACRRLARLLRAPDIQAASGDRTDVALVEAFIEGREFAVEGLLTHGQLQTLAIFDKPDPLDGPFFEETIYVTPSTMPAGTQQAIVDAVTAAARAIGLRHGPIHAECRVNPRGVYVLEVAARPIGGLCAGALRFVSAPARAGSPESDRVDSERPMALEELLMRHALGERADRYAREPRAAGVMMIPIPKRGVLRRVEGVEAARALPGIDEIRITAKPDQLLTPLPEGASYLGFIFARGASPAFVERALRDAHAGLTTAIDPEVRVLQSTHG